MPEAFGFFPLQIQNMETFSNTNDSVSSKVNNKGGKKKRRTAVDQEKVKHIRPSINMWAILF